MAIINRKATVEEKEEALKNDKTFSMAQIEDVCALIATEQWPDWRFSDDEVCLWSTIRIKLGIDY